MQDGGRPAHVPSGLQVRTTGSEVEKPALHVYVAVDGKRLLLVDEKVYSEPMGRAEQRTPLQVGSLPDQLPSELQVRVGESRVA